MFLFSVVLPKAPEEVQSSSRIGLWSVFYKALFPLNSKLHPPLSGDLRRFNMKVHLLAWLWPRLIPSILHALWAQDVHYSPSPVSSSSTTSSGFFCLSCLCFFCDFLLSFEMFSSFKLHGRTDYNCTV